MRDRKDERGDLGRRALVTGAAAAIVLSSPRVVVAAPRALSLFRIERSKNANIVQYDAMVEGDDLDAKAPVVGYWVMKAEDGKRKGLNAFDKLAYGFSVEPERGTKAWFLRLKAASDKAIRLHPTAPGRWVPLVDIDKRLAVLERLYVATNESGIVPKVLYVDVFGVEASTGAAVRERLIP